MKWELKKVNKFHLKVFSCFDILFSGKTDIKITPGMVDWRLNYLSYSSLTPKDHKKNIFFLNLGYDDFMGEV